MTQNKGTTHYYQFGCGILKMVGKARFLAKNQYTQRKNKIKNKYVDE